MTKFVFKPGPPKQSKEISLAALKKLVKNGGKITGAKNVGGNTYKVFMEGSWNYYIEGSKEFLRFALQLNGVNV